MSVLDATLVRGRRIGAALLAIVAAACATPGAPPSSSGPRFDQAGPDADAYGAREGYPLGDRASFFRVPFLVGSQSHLDEIFPGRPVRRAATPSSLARAGSEPALRYVTFCRCTPPRSGPTGGPTLGPKPGCAHPPSWPPSMPNPHHHSQQWNNGPTTASAASGCGLACASASVRAAAVAEGHRPPGESGPGAAPEPARHREAAHRLSAPSAAWEDPAGLRRRHAQDRRDPEEGRDGLEVIRAAKVSLD